MKRTMIALALAMRSAEAALANPPVDDVNAEHCLELKINGQAASCNNDLRLVDNGKTGVKMVVGFTTAQTPDMKNG